MHSVEFVIVEPEEQDFSPLCSINNVPGASVGACVVATKIKYLYPYTVILIFNKESYVFSLNAYSRLIGLPGHVSHFTGHCSWMNVEQQSVAFSISEHHDISAQPRIIRSKNIDPKLHHRNN